MEKNSVSFVIPCLNEQATLGLVLAAINATAAKHGLNYEIVVSDNGSTDDSIKIAESHGARVAHATERGYGAALLKGISSAKNDIVVFADADFTYNFEEAPKLINKLIEGNYDLVLGDRLGGYIEYGAMPFLHRYVGTPVLSFLISIIVAGKAGAVKDCNSGFRVFRKAKFAEWDVASTGMEFASEMLVNSISRKAKIGWEKISLRKDVRGRIPHLKTWRDGMRHLLQILVAGPKFIRNFGISIFMLGLLFFIPGFFVSEPLNLTPSIFGIHTLIFSSFVMFVGFQVMNLAEIIYALRNGDSNLLQMSEDRLFFGSVSLIGVSFIVWVSIFWMWSTHMFQELNAQKFAILGMDLGLFGISSAISLIGLHLIKRAKKVTPVQKVESTKSLAESVITIG